MLELKSRHLTWVGPKSAPSKVVFWQPKNILWEHALHVSLTKLYYTHVYGNEYCNRKNFEETWETS